MFLSFLVGRVWWPWQLCDVSSQKPKSVLPFCLKTAVSGVLRYFEVTNDLWGLLVRSCSRLKDCWVCLQKIVASEDAALGDAAFNPACSGCDCLCSLSAWSLFVRNLIFSYVVWVDKRVNLLKEQHSDAGVVIFQAWKDWRKGSEDAIGWWDVISGFLFMKVVL